MKRFFQGWYRGHFQGRWPKTKNQWRCPRRVGGAVLFLVGITIIILIAGY